MTNNTMFVYTFHVDDQEQNTTIIRMYGVNDVGETTCLQIHDFYPYVYVELPRKYEWTRESATAVVNRLTSIMKTRQHIKKDFVRKFKLYGAHLDEKTGERQRFPYLKLWFATRADINYLRAVLRNPLFVSGYTSELKLNIHEAEASTILQLICTTGIPSAGWIEFKPSTNTTTNTTTTTNKVTSAHTEVSVSYRSLRRLKTREDHVAHPVVLSFDIEVNSSKGVNVFPKAVNLGDCIFQISCVLFNHPGAYRGYLLSLGDPCDIEAGQVDANLPDATEVRRFRTEAELIMGFADFIKEHHANVIIGYNIFGFDIKYLMDRAKKPCMCYSSLRRTGFHLEQLGVEDVIKWVSTAFGHQEHKYLKMEGRIFIDLMNIVQRRFKLNKYDLNTVSEEILKDKKEDLSPAELFACYRAGMAGDRSALHRTGTYAMKDALLVARLADRLQMWVGAVEEAKVYNSTIFSLYTSGQQIKVFSKVYEYCCRAGYVVDLDGYQSKDNERYMGAYVFEPVPGYYHDVVPLDFSSLYPSVIIAFNLSYDTLVTDESVPDHLCHVMEWEEHFLCDHDPKFVKYKELDAHIMELRDKLRNLRQRRDEKASKRDAREYLGKQISRLDAEVRRLAEKRKVMKKSLNSYYMCARRRYRFSKSPEGVLPAILRSALSARADIKKRMKTGGWDELTRLVLDKRQLAVKLLANSAYGACGASKGYLPNMPIAMCTTYMGRLNIEKTASAIKEKFKGEVVYGDSVAGDTPILCMLPDGTFTIRTIDSVMGGGDEGKWESYDGFKAGDSNRKEKQQIMGDGIKVWTKGKWSNVVRVIRHKTTKRMFRVNTHIGCIDVSEDHSLLNAEAREIKPTEVEIGQRLYHSFPDKFDYKLQSPSIIVEDVHTCKKCKSVKPIYEFYEDMRLCKQCVWNSNAIHRTGLRGKVDHYFSEEEYLRSSYSHLSAEEALVWGFFMGDGSCGAYSVTGSKGHKFSWAINNQNLEYLVRAQKILEVVEPYFTFPILDTMTSSGVYKLVCKGRIRLLVKKYRPLFYDKDDYKIVPYCVLNSSLEIRKAFFEGYYMADGAKSEADRIIPNVGVRMDCKGKIGAQGLYYLLKSIGYEHVAVRSLQVDRNIYTLAAASTGFRKDPWAVKKVIELPPVSDSTYIYDIETEEGVFQAGIGEMVVKNTDSNYIRFPHIHTAPELWDYAIHVAAEVSKMFPPPMKLEFEMFIYHKFIIFSKKRYMYLSSDREGVLSSAIGKRGIVLVRRDNAKIVRILFERALRMIFDNAGFYEVWTYILEQINVMFARGFDASVFVITQSVGDVNDMKIESDEDGCLRAGKYKVPELKAETHDKQLKKKKATTDEEFYERCIPAIAQLAQRVRRRNQHVEIGERLEHVFLESERYNDANYFKIEHYQYYKRHSDVLKLDYYYYFEKIARALDPLLDVVFNSDGFLLKEFKFRLKHHRVLLVDIRNLFCPLIKISRQ